MSTESAYDLGKVNLNRRNDGRRELTRAMAERYVALRRREDEDPDRFLIDYVVPDSDGGDAPTAGRSEDQPIDQPGEGEGFHPASPGIPPIGADPRSHGSGGPRSLDPAPHVHRDGQHSALETEMNTRGERDTAPGFVGRAERGPNLSEGVESTNANQTESAPRGSAARGGMMTSTRPTGKAGSTAKSGDDLSEGKPGGDGDKIEEEIKSGPPDGE